jgi:hypothetical protein
MTYLHTQRSLRLALFNAVMALIPVGLLLSGSLAGAPTGARITLLAVVLILLASAFTFSSFTIAAGNGRLVWWFGPRLLRKEVPLASIESAEPTTTSIVNGWGIHLTTRGWLYNVAGRQAVLVSLRGGKQFLLGTDEPARLVEALRQNSSHPR